MSVAHRYRCENGRVYMPVVSVAHRYRCQNGHIYMSVVKIFMSVHVGTDRRSYQFTCQSRPHRYVNRYEPRISVYISYDVDLPSYPIFSLHTSVYMSVEAPPTCEPMCPCHPLPCGKRPSPELPAPPPSDAPPPVETDPLRTCTPVFWPMPPPFGNRPSPDLHPPALSDASAPPAPPAPPARPTSVYMSVV